MHDNTASTDAPNVAPAPLPRQLSKVGRAALFCIFEGMQPRITLSSNLPKLGENLTLDACIATHCRKREQACRALYAYKRQFLSLKETWEFAPEERMQEVKTRLGSFESIVTEALDTVMVRYFRAQVPDLSDPYLSAMEHCTMRNWNDALSTAFKSAKSRSRVNGVALTLERDLYHNRFTSIARMQHYLGVSQMCASDLHDAILYVWRKRVGNGQEAILTTTDAQPEPNLVYYIAGWILHKLRKLSDITKFSCNREQALETKLPCLLTVARERRDGLAYPCKSFFEFIFRVEQVFMANLSIDKLAACGCSLIDDISNALTTDDVAKGLYADAVRAHDSTLPMLKIVQTYSKMRGADFVHKARSALKIDSDTNATRQQLAALSKNGKHNTSTIDDDLVDDDASEVADIVAEAAARIDDDDDGDDDDDE